MSEKYPKIKPIKIANRQWINRSITNNPRWCAVDLRDGNQALPNPLTVQEKLTYFNLLLSIGFKEIEVGFPSASIEEFNFCRYLIENSLIPSDVKISVLSPCRKSLIKKTLKALESINKATIHIYIACSPLHRKFVLKKSKDEIIKTALNSVQYIIDKKKSNLALEFSPEEFTDTELDFSIKLCQEVTDLWQKNCNEEIILNLPATVERREPTQYADMIEVFFTKLKPQKKNLTISLHAHNDMGCGLAATQLALKAGANRVEGTLFGHGERSGNIDLATLALNLEYLGIDTKLDFSNLIDISSRVTRLTGIEQHCRHPYVGSLVFSAFSGSHQDAIHKSFLIKDELKKYFKGWKIPYLHIKPSTIGRKFEKFIRINSQSGKGGLKHILMLEHKISLPEDLLMYFTKKVQFFSEEKAREISSQEIWSLFNDCFFKKGKLNFINYFPFPDEKQPPKIIGKAKLSYEGVNYELSSRGDGPIAAFTYIIRQIKNIPTFSIEWYKEDSLQKSAEAEAVSYIAIVNKKKKKFFGVAIDKNTVQAACLSLVSAVNNMLKVKKSD